MKETKKKEVKKQKVYSKDDKVVFCSNNNVHVGSISKYMVNQYDKDDVIYLVNTLSNSPDYYELKPCQIIMLVTSEQLMDTGEFSSVMSRL